MTGQDLFQNKYSLLNLVYNFVYVNKARFSYILEIFKKS